MFSKSKYKVVTLGSSGVGKTSLMIRFVQDVFTEDQPSTIGASFLIKRLNLVVNGKDHLGEGTTLSKQDNLQTGTLQTHNIEFEIFDTAGQERYESLAPMYYRSARAAIVIYDVTNRDSWDRAKKWVTTLEETQVGSHNQINRILIVILGNKVDLGNKIVSTQELKDFVQGTNHLAYETSAKSSSLLEVNDKIVRSTDMNTIFTDIAIKLIEHDQTKLVTAVKTISPVQNLQNSKQDTIFKRLISPCALI